MQITTYARIFCAMLLSFNTFLCYTDATYDIFHWQTQPDRDPKTGIGKKYDSNYTTLRNTIRILGMTAGVYAASTLVSNHIGHAGLLLPGKIVATLLPTVVGFGLVCYLRKKLVSWFPSVVSPKKDSYEASVQYGMCRYFF